MSDHSLKRSFFFCILFLLAAGSAFAASPSARFETRMVWDPAIHRAVLFGGLTAIDAGTKVEYELADTWEWTGTRWIQVFPAHSPSARAPSRWCSTPHETASSSSAAGRASSISTTPGASTATTGLRSTPPTAPPVRELAGAAYDSVRDRIVLFGGSIRPTAPTERLLTETPLHDTWEFDGTNWTQVLADGPAVTKPMLEYDPVRKQTIMMAVAPPRQR